MSSINSLAASLTSAIEKATKELEESRELLDREREQLAEEKQRMSRFSASGSDLVKVNVGGKVFQTHRATLLSAEGSLLEAIFSGRWEESLVRDDAGNVFFDFEPAAFRAVLNYLRSRGLAEPGQAVPPPQVAPEHRGQLEAMVAFMGLKEIVCEKMAAAPMEAMALAQAGCRDGSVAIEGGRLQTGANQNQHRCVVGTQRLLAAGAPQQRLAWKVTVRQHSNWVLAGVTTNAAPPDASQSDAGTYAWSSGGYVWSGGGIAASDWPGWQTGDVSIFQLDAMQLTLRMHLRRTGTVYTLPVSPDVARSARLHFNLFGEGNVVEVSQVTRQELSDAGF